MHAAGLPGPKKLKRPNLVINSFKKGQIQMAKWPNHFISGKQFQKRPNGNPGMRLFCTNEMRSFFGAKHLENGAQV